MVGTNFFLILLSINVLNRTDRTSYKFGTIRPTLKLFICIHNQLQILKIYSYAQNAMLPKFVPQLIFIYYYKQAFIKLFDYYFRLLSVFYKFNSMREIFILSLLLLTLPVYSCPTNYQITNLQAGSAIFQTTQKTSSIVTATYEHVFEVVFSHAPTVAYSIHNIVINIPIALEWSISTDKITNNKLSIRFRYLPLQWILIKCGFLAGGRKDIILGSISSNFQSLKQNSVSIAVDLNETIPNYSSSILRVFLSGFTMRSGEQYFIRTLDKNIGQKRIQIGIQVGGSMQITQIQLNYIIFNPRMLNFASYGGGQNQIMFNQSKVYNIEKNIYHSDYKFYGIGHMRHSGQNSIAFLSNIDNQFYLRLDSLKPFQEIFVAYIILGISPAQLCRDCNQFTSVSDRQCMRQCPADSYPISYQDGGKGCRRCPSQYNMILNSTKNGCQCRSGHVKKRGFCVDLHEISNISPITSLIQKLLKIINRKQQPNPFSFVPSQNFQSHMQSPSISQTSVSKQNIQEASRMVGSNSNTTKQQMNVAYYGANYAPTPVSPSPSLSPSSTEPIDPNNNSGIKAAVSVINPDMIPNLSPGKQQSFIPYVPTIITSNPSIPSQQVRTSGHKNIISSTSQTENQINSIYAEKNCSQFPYSYWTGYRCACKVGYAMNGSNCQPIIRGAKNFFNRPAQFVKRLSALVLNSQRVQKETDSRLKQEQIWEIKQNFNHRAGQNHKRPPCDNSINGQCKKKQEPINCGQYQYRNSSGHCSCLQGYTLEDRKCVRIRNICGPNSLQGRSGNCQCIKGYSLYGKFCLLCPPGHISVEGKCEYTCGINQIVNLVERNLNKCICKQNYGRLDGICQICPDSYFNINGYCATCPIRTIYNPQTKRCICEKGFVLRNGVFCQKLCNDKFQQYCSETNKCKCLNGYSRVGSQCRECQSGIFDPFTSQCIIGCRINEIRVQGRCICKPQYGYGQNKQCIRCYDTPGGFLIDGQCAKCPQNQIYVNQKCSCPKDKKLVLNKCVNICNNPSQLVDSNGFCYYCPVNEEIVGNKCDCKRGYERVNNICVVKCPANLIQINGICGFCAMRTEYCPIRKTCLCPNNYYMSREGACQMLIPSTQCPLGSYYSLQTKKCKPCGNSCKSCKRQQSCQECIEQGYYPSGSLCISKCGDGIKIQSQLCDDGNTNNFDGCSSNCQIQPLYSCQGTKPSRCTKKKGICGDGIVNFDQQCDDKNANRGDGCFNCLVEQGWQCRSNICSKILQQNSQVSATTPQKSEVGTNSVGTNLQQAGQPIINISNVIVVLQCPTAFQFQSDSQMRSFLKYRFLDKSTEPRSVYCVQRSKTPKLFDCLNIYPSGVPVKQFDIHYSYSFEGQTGETTVHIKTLKNRQMRSRTVK